MFSRDQYLPLGRQEDEAEMVSPSSCRRPGADVSASSLSNSHKQLRWSGLAREGRRLACVMNVSMGFQWLVIVRERDVI